VEIKLVEREKFKKNQQFLNITVDYFLLVVARLKDMQHQFNNILAKIF